MKHNGKIYETVDQYELDNNIKMCQLNDIESKFYNLPIFIFKKKKNFSKRLSAIKFNGFLKKEIKLQYMSDLEGKRNKAK